MAPKRSAPPPPPSPPVASSEETASGSGSEEEEDEEEIAHSPPLVAPKSVAPPPQEDQESEASDEDEDGEEEDDDEEEEHEKANHVIPSSATKTPPPPPTREESETSDEGEEEEEEAAGDKMPQTKPAPNREVEAKGAKRPSAPFQRTWSTDDEIRILEALAAHRLEHGTQPQTDVLANALAGKLDNSGCSLSELQRKVKSLHSRISKAVKKGALPSKDDRRLFDLFKNVWPSVTKKAAPKAVANSGAGREPDEMCELYPYLAEEVQALQKAHPGLFKREFAMIDDSKARALDEKIKKQRHVQLKLHIRRHDLIKEVTKTLTDLTE